ncbi:hypothetical protein B0A69_12070 [Chryseobacterium shigense]|uniref:Uncharacterized protein n=1 Tax=Chryseobacterium shigense TaxID=297244 RepID=A0A1N7JP06_9FLAO|nr:hypothetical protein [Chryseobacterium shigense]PQA92902.1 hypothetical protein B0A69_12070 [Chryseobacterium shigense]SIS51050.1 hypothetical protein SAMN05421639_10780 [Chryseobacterium shigense]
MKNLLNIGLSVLFSGLVFVSCEDDDYQTVQSIGKIRIDSVKIMQDTMDVNSIQSIKTYSTYLSQCEGFYGYDYIPTSSLERSVTAYKYTIEGQCVQKAHVGTSQINFSPRQKGSYTFKFWNGGNNWITKTIVVE